MKVKHKEFFTHDGMGTELVAPFLYNFCRLIRPEKILEIGMGYTTPFLLDAIVDNQDIYIDGNIDNDYLNKDYLPKLVSINDKWNSKFDCMLNNPFVDFYVEKFQGKSFFLKEKYKKFDFVWFDCGGELEYKQFIEEYWDLCSEYIIFHYTYHDKKPNSLYYSIINNIKELYENISIIEPHKYRQGSITIIKKNKKFQRKNILYV